MELTPPSPHEWPKMQTMMKSPWGPIDYTLGILRNVNIRGDAWRGLIFVDNHHVQNGRITTVPRRCSHEVSVMRLEPIRQEKANSILTATFCIELLTCICHRISREQIVSGICEGSRVIREWANMRVIIWAPVMRLAQLKE